MFQDYGINRVVEPKQVLPISAWRLDNSREIASNEIRISMRRIHVETTSFKQICLEANNNDERIKEKITDIIIKRGKLHNPVTDTGGVLYGVVEEIGNEYENSKGLKIGEEVICNTSLAGVPIYISKITEIDRAYTQIEVVGYAVVFNKIPLVRRPEGLPIPLLLFAFNESGTLYRVSRESKGKEKFLVVGNNLMMNMLFGFAVRKIAGENAKIVCLFDKKTDIVVEGKAVDNLISSVFDEIHYVNILKPIECLESLSVDDLFDISINCADIPGAETINILATKPHGTVIFANLINNYNIALYITESVSKPLEIRCADGYLEEYADFDIELVKEMAPYLEGAVTTAKGSRGKQPPFGGIDQRFMEAESYRNSMTEGFVCESHAMSAVMEEILSVAKYDCNVLITGETGVGKEKIANIIQKNSKRKMQPFIKVNCAAIAPNLMESEFFGYEKGSFTGANVSGKKGYFELADNGIIFLDEVGELPLDIQAKLLRVTQDGEFFRVGGAISIKTDVRILSATNRDLEVQIEEKLFRRDLYYRLNVFPIRVPSLKERIGEVPALIRHFTSIYSEKFGVSRTFEEDSIEYLAQKEWPGNIRELENVVQRLMITSKNEAISLFEVMKQIDGQLFAKISGEGTLEFAEEGSVVDLSQWVDNFEKNIIKFALDRYGSTRKAAVAIGISQTQMVRKKNKYEL